MSFASPSKRLGQPQILIQDFLCMLFWFYCVKGSLVLPCCFQEAQLRKQTVYWTPSLFSLRSPIAPDSRFCVVFAELWVYVVNKELFSSRMLAEKPWLNQHDWSHYHVSCADHVTGERWLLMCARLEARGWCEQARCYQSKRKIQIPSSVLCSIWLQVLKSVCVSRLQIFMYCIKCWAFKCVCECVYVSDLVIIWRVGIESNWGRGGVRHTEINLNTED